MRAVFSNTNFRTSGIVTSPARECTIPSLCAAEIAQALLNFRGPLFETRIKKSMKTKSPWLVTDEAAAYLRVHRRTLLKWTLGSKGHKLSGTLRTTWLWRESDWTQP